jgi:hypothetical protein
MQSRIYQSIEGMTVNERLCHFGLTDEYGEAIRSNSKGLAISVLERAKFTREQAEFTVQTTLADPKRYVY